MSLTPLCYGIPVLIYNIPANKEVGLPVEQYFRCGDVDELKEKKQFRDLGPS
jgi:dihydrodipicolinate synthase/N-acetylneuraminate lyase